MGVLRGTYLYKRFRRGLCCGGHAGGGNDASRKHLLHTKMGVGFRAGV